MNALKSEIDTWLTSSKMFAPIWIPRGAVWKIVQNRFDHGYIGDAQWWTALGIFWTMRVKPKQIGNYVVAYLFGFVVAGAHRLWCAFDVRQMRFQDYQPLPWVHDGPNFLRRGQGCKHEKCRNMILLYRSPGHCRRKCQHNVKLHLDFYAKKVQAVWLRRQ